MRRLVLAFFPLALPLTACGAPDDRLPRARDQRIATTEDQPVEVVLDGDDPDGDRLTWSAGQPAHGTLALRGARAVYTPDPDFHGTDHVLVTVSDGELSARAFVVFDVGAVPDAPRLMHDTFPAGEDEALHLATHALLANDRDPDGDPLRVTAVKAISGGAIRLADGEVVFTPTRDHTGMARFHYAVSDGRHTETAEVILRVGASNNPPIATADHLATLEDQPLVVAGSELLRNDRDPDGDSLSITAVLGALGGRVELDELEVRFVPAPDATGAAGFAYRVSDGQAEHQGWVDVWLGPVDDPAPCGDGVVDPDEACDDGNLVDGDGCDHGCALTGCGNGVVASAPITAATLRWLGATCAGADAVIALAVDGVTVLVVPGGDGACGCDEPVRSVPITDPAALAAFAGHAVLDLRFPGPSSHLAWAEVVLEVGGEPRTLPLFSAGHRERGAPWPEHLCETTTQTEVAAATGWVLGEECDDGNVDAGDGCSAVCTAE